MSILNQEIIARFREAFEMFDTDQDGAITFQDLTKIFILLGITITEQELLDTINEVDINRDDIIEYDEYISLIARKIRDSDLQEEQQEAFKIFDRDRDGKISLEELKFVMTIIAKNLLNKDISDEEVFHMFSLADKDGDGFLSYEEFDNIINQNNN